ncbi:hypothetical protein [Burkholderia vietnamiensis]|uniref:hypothetical protein n=1 Tax=Burkholderia vietnamiensis TaxID=60552 RepID=UPI001B8F0A7D|nr:hypothetical protein [Burkholderia vietnamiensis]MBR8283920.1 hypothetical protein [Burkholderia vietnamiensis]
MNVAEQWKLNGNLKRITEMAAAGAGPHTIAGAFRDDNINVSGEQIAAITSALPELCRKALSKKKSQTVIEAVKTQKPGPADNDGAFQPT